MSTVGRASQETAQDGAQQGDGQITHIAAVRAARVRHKAIAKGLQVYFDTVTAEQIPVEFLEILNRMDQKSLPV